MSGLAGSEPSRRPAALVLAAERRGVVDPVAATQGKSHKCLIEIGGVVMLERVVSTLLESGEVGRILVSIESEAPLRSTPRLAQWLDAGTIEFFPSQESLADSVLAIADWSPDALPLVVTTGDNALHTAELVAEFVRRFMASDCDVAVGFTREDTVLAGCPDAGLNFHRLRGGGWSSCNLYGLRDRRVLATAEVFRSGGQFGKRPWRLLRAFGILPFLLYRFRATTLDGLMARIGRNLGVKLEAIELPWFFGPIDIDKPRFIGLAEEILKRRGA